MKLVQQNPYRIVGLLSNASLRETLNRKNKIKAFSSVGKEVPSDYDFPFLEAIKRENGTIENAFSKIEQNKNKVLHSIFWFANGNAFDSTALDYLKAGDEEKTLDIWEKVTDGKEISNKNFTSFNNLGTLYLATQKVKEGIQLKLKLLESNSFDDFINIVADENYTLSEQERTHLFIDELVSILKESYTQNQIIQLFKNTTKSAKDYITKIFSSDAIHTIEVILKKTSKKRQNNKLEAYKYGKELLSKTKTELNQLKSILGTSDLQYKMLADNVAKEILQCAIDYFNENDDRESNGDYLKESLELANSAQTIAVKDMTKDRIKDNIRTLEGMKERDINQAISFLKFIEDSYEKNKREIEDEVRRLESTDIEILLGHKSINWDSVRQNIKNSIKWTMVVETIENSITETAVIKIRTNPDNSKKREFKRLVEFLDSKISYSLSSRIDYLKYWEVEAKMEQEIKSIERNIKDISNKNLVGKNLVDARKIKKDLELKLQETNSKTFYSDKIKIEQQKLINLKKWKLFRTRETREKQIASQELVIKKLKDNSLKDKQNEIEKIKMELRKTNQKIDELEAKNIKLQQEEKIRLEQKLKTKKNELQKFKGI